MKLENQVCTLEQSIRLNELGVDLISQFAWCWNGSKMIGGAKDFFINLDGFKDEWAEAYPSFTVSEVGVMLPNHTFQYKGSECIIKHSRIGGISYSEIYTVGRNDILFSAFSSVSTAISHTALLIYCLENNLTTPLEVNQRLNNA